MLTISHGEIATDIRYNGTQEIKTPTEARGKSPLALPSGPKTNKHNKQEPKEISTKIIPPVSTHEDHTVEEERTEITDERHTSKRQYLSSRQAEGNHHQRYERVVSLHEALEEPMSIQTHETGTQNFTLNIQNGRILLYYGKQFLIDLTISERLELTISDIVSYSRGTISITSGLTETGQFHNFEKLIVYNGTGVHTLTSNDEGVTVLVAIVGEIILCGTEAFYSRNDQLNKLLNERLARLARISSSKTSKPNIPAVEFKAVIGGQTILVIDSAPVIVLTGAEPRSISDRQFLLYSNSTLRVHDITTRYAVETFLGIEKMLFLSELEGIKEYSNKKPVLGQVTGGGNLYVHITTGTAFYLRDVTVNKKIRQFLANPIPPLQTVFSIEFESGSDGGGGGGGLRVVVTADSKVVVKLKPCQVIDQSIAPQHYITYANNTVYVMEREAELDAITDVYEVRFYDGNELLSYATSSPLQIPGGGQLFWCEGVAFYSVDAGLNDRIGDALLGAENRAL